MLVTVCLVPSNFIHLKYSEDRGFLGLFYFGETGYLEAVQL